jgi:phage shock protein A
MGLLERIKNLVSSNLNDLLEKAEDPENVLTQLIADMEEDLAEARLEVASASRDERALHDEYQDHKSRAKKMARKAVTAVEQGDDELAREALRRRRASDRLARTLGQQWEVQRDSMDALRKHLEGLELKIEEARRKKHLIIARRRLAQAQKGLQATASYVSTAGAGEAFERIEDRVEDLEAEADAAAELASSFLEARFERLSDEAQQVDAELEEQLARIKAEVEKKRAGEAPAEAAPDQAQDA